MQAQLAHPHSLQQACDAPASACAASRSCCAPHPTHHPASCRKDAVSHAVSGEQVSLEELGATGNLGLSQIALNPVIQGAFGGLATSASQFATAEVLPNPGLNHIHRPMCSRRLPRCIASACTKLQSPGPQSACTGWQLQTSRAWLQPQCWSAPCVKRLQLSVVTLELCLQRMLLFNIKSEIVEPFGETVQQVFARISALRDSLDGPQVGI